jgi:integrase
MPTGLKSFVVQYRTPTGRNKRTVIGRYGLMTVEEARTLAFEKLAMVSKGIDPEEQAQAKAAAELTVDDICDWYLSEAEAGRILGRRRRPIRPSTLRMDRSRIDAHEALRKAEADGEHPKGIAAIRFLLLTGFRRMEGLGLQRAWLDDEEGSIRFPDTKSGAQTRVIGDAAIKVLLAQPQIGKSPYFFPADWGDGHFIGIVRVLDRVCAMAKLEDVTPHTLRHTFASVAAELGFSELTIAALLGHAARGVTQRYIHIDEALMMTSDKVAQEIADLLDGRAPAPRRRVRRAELTGQVLEVATAENEQP